MECRASDGMHRDLKRNAEIFSDCAIVAGRLMAHERITTTRANTKSVVAVLVWAQGIGLDA